MSEWEWHNVMVGLFVDVVFVFVFVFVFFFFFFCGVIRIVIRI
jgi:hypothetical protein